MASDAETTAEYVGHQPAGCRQCDRGYRDGSGGWWCCGDGKQRRAETTLADAFARWVIFMIALNLLGATLAIVQAWSVQP